MNRILEGFVNVDREELEQLLHKFKTMEGVKEFLSKKLESAVAEELHHFEIPGRYCPMCDTEMSLESKFSHCSLDCADAALEASKRITA